MPLKQKIISDTKLSFWNIVLITFHMISIYQRSSLHTGLHIGVEFAVNIDHKEKQTEFWKKFSFSGSLTRILRLL